MARILIADDDQVQRKMLGAVLQAEGHEVVGEAADGAELVRLANETLPDLIITDIVMPEITGIEAAAEIYATRPTAIMVLSGFSDSELVAKGFQNHVLSYLLKPVDRKQLAAGIMMALRQHEQLMELREQSVSLEKALVDRKIVERAKGVMIARMKMTEDEAHRKLQQMARSHNAKVVDMAKTVLSAANVI